MLKVTLIGNLGGEPERRQANNGRIAVSFSVAASNGRDRAPTWVNVTAWDNLGEICAKYLHKGSKAAVIGRPAARAWLDKSGKACAALELTATEVEFLSSRQEHDPLPAEDVDPQTGCVKVDPEDKPW